MGRKTLDLVGKRFGRLTVVEYDSCNQHGKSMWNCRCECGNTCLVRGTRLTSGHTKSCGCYSQDITKVRATTHGLSNTRLYNIWRVMRKRCDYENGANYKHYGAKGIRVCAEWYNFENFRDWAITNGYEDGLTIDRIDNNGNYTPENCRWVDMKAQSRNTSRNKLITFRGETHCMQDWADILGINYRTIQQRINVYGWSAERALTTPIGNNGRK